ncbi:usg protein [Rhodovulum sp. DZ06]|uniref:usg protein n=1 Tax=Rhodovulum sp. DZ06 TaxID=3425126 RepID=UPI003D347E02
MRKVDEDFRKQLAGYSLATAEITYRLPDARRILQTFTWQDYDIAPKFPRLQAFLDFWDRELDGPLHSVRLVHHALIGPKELRYVTAEYQLH